MWRVPLPAFLMSDHMNQAIRQKVRCPYGATVKLSRTCQTSVIPERRPPSRKSLWKDPLTCRTRDTCPHRSSTERTGAPFILYGQIRGPIAHGSLVVLPRRTPSGLGPRTSSGSFRDAGACRSSRSLDGGSDFRESGLRTPSAASLGEFFAAPAVNRRCPAKSAPLTRFL